MKKILAAILALTMATAVFASCGSNDDDSSSKAETTSSAASKDESKADDAVSKGDDKVQTPKPIEDVKTTLENQDKASITFNKNMNPSDFIEELGANNYTDDESHAKLSIEEVAGIPMLKIETLDTNRKNEYKVPKIHFLLNKLFEGHEDQLPNIFNVEVEFVTKAVGTIKNDDGEECHVPAFCGGKLVAQPYNEDEKTQKWEELEEFGWSEWVSEWGYQLVSGTPGAKPTSSYINTKEPQYLALMKWSQPNQADLYVANITFYDKEGNVIPCDYGK